MRKHYPSLILGFVRFLPKESLQAVVRTSNRKLPWERLKRDFICKFELSTNFDSCCRLVPLSSIVHPLMAYRINPKNKNTFACAIPKRCWADYFDARIVTDKASDKLDDPIADNSEDECESSSDEDSANDSLQSDSD